MSKKGGGRPRRPGWWRPAGRSDTDCTAKRYRLINDRSAPCGTCTHTLSLLYLSPTPPRAGGRTRSGSAKTGEEVTQRQPRLVLSVWSLQVQVNAGCGQKARFLVQGKNNRYPQICSFTACGGGVSGVSLVGSVGVCEAASQCGDGKGSVLPMGSCYACLLFACQKARKSVLCVCERDVVKPTERSWSVSHSSSSAVVMHGADIVVRFLDL